MKTKKNKHANKKSPRQKTLARRRSKENVPPNKPAHKQTKTE